MKSKGRGKRSTPSPAIIPVTYLVTSPITTPDVANGYEPLRLSLVAYVV